MGYAIGNVTSANSDAHKLLLGIIKTLAEDNGWTTLRYDTSGADHELILQGEGLSGTEEIYVGFRTYEKFSADYYNINCGVFTGYVSGAPFEGQPGAKYSGCPAHNNAIDYWIAANPQRIVGCLKVGTPVYEHFYLGKFLPYARPSEYPYPVICASMFNGPEAKRYSDTNQLFPYPGHREQTTYNNLWLRDLSGVWTRPTCYPWRFTSSATYSLAGAQGTSTLVPLGDEYQIEPVIPYSLPLSGNPDHNNENVWGEFDGVYFCSGFNNASENVLQIGGNNIVNQSGMTVLQAVDEIVNIEHGRAFVIMQNVHRTQWRDYIALEMK